MKLISKGLKAIRGHRTTKEQKKTGKPEAVISSGRSSFNKDIEKVKSMNLKPETKNKKLIDVYKKHNRKVPANLIKPVGRKIGGSIKNKTQSGHNRLY